MQIKEGLNRILCLAPYGIVNFKVVHCSFNRTFISAVHIIYIAILATVYTRI